MRICGKGSPCFTSARTFVLSHVTFRLSKVCWSFIAISGRTRIRQHPQRGFRTLIIVIIMTSLHNKSRLGFNLIRNTWPDFKQASSINFAPQTVCHDRAPSCRDFLTTASTTPSPRLHRMSASRNHLHGKYGAQNQISTSPLD
jgi:hypothetical protein